MARSSEFEAQAGRYDRWFDENPQVFALELAALKTLLPDFKRGLEIGSGSGRFGSALGLQIGLEPSPAMAGLAHSRGLQMVQGVAEELPFAAGHFDLALMVTTFCFLDQPAVALQEAWRILQPGGHLLLLLIDKDSQLGRQYAQRAGKSGFYREARFYSLPEISMFLSQNGFGHLRHAQTLFYSATGVLLDTISSGYGQGSVVVILAEKIS